MIEKTFLNPATNKQWRIEIDGHTVRTCLNGGKVKEILCDSAFQVKSKTASAMMSQMRKGFVYQNPDAAVGQARCHRFVGKDSNGFTAGYPQTKRSSSPVTRPKSNTTRKKSTPIQIGRWSDFMRMRASLVPRLKSERLFSR